MPEPSTASASCDDREVAEDIVKHLHPRRVLQVDCGRGELVAELVGLGVDAAGVDSSERAAAGAVAAARGRVSVHDLMTPLEGHWDLVICFDVLSRFAPGEEKLALDQVCAAADRVLFRDGGATAGNGYVNFQPFGAWVAAFAQLGFFRRLDLELATLGPGAALFERRLLTAADVARLYEDATVSLREEVWAHRRALQETERQGDEPSDQEREAGDRILGLLDEVMGLQAELAETRYRHDQVLRAAAHAELASRQDLEEKLAAAEARAAASEQRVAEMLASRSWRIGQAVLRPLTPVRARVNRRG